MSAPRLRGDEATAHTADIPSKNCSAVSSADVVATSAQARAVAQLLRMPEPRGHPFRPLLRGRGRRSAPFLPARGTLQLPVKILAAARTGNDPEARHPATTPPRDCLLPRQLISRRFVRPWLGRRVCGGAEG